MAQNRTHSQTTESAESLDIGDQLPSMTLLDDQGERVDLDQLRGRWVVLYFYPKDDTSGCTAQACDLRDHWSEFDRPDVAVFGVSPDPVESHSRFRAKHSLPFHLLVDEGAELATRFGIWRQKSMYGRTYMGVERSTIIADPSGNVVCLARKVKPAEHVALLRTHLPPQSDT